MTELFVQVLPLALGVAISPVPILAVLAVLLSPTARRWGPVFGFSWLLGTTAVLVLFTLVGGRSADGDGSPTVVRIVQVSAAVVLLGLAALQWRERPGAKHGKPLPTWMSHIDAMSWVRVVALGLFLSIVNPKNFVLAADAGTALGRHTEPGQAFAVGAAWLVLATVSVWFPVGVSVVVGHLADATLARARDWLARYSAVLVVVVFVLVAANLLRKAWLGV